MSRLVDWGYYLSWAALIVGSTFIVGALVMYLLLGAGHA